MDYKEIQTKLLTEQKSAKERMEQLKLADPFMDPGYADDNAAVDTDVREQENHQRIEAEMKTLEKRLQDITIALERVASKTYGKCKRCNKSIPEKRLELIPESSYCVTCESELTR